MNINGEFDYGSYPSTDGNVVGNADLEQKLQNFTASVGTNTNIGGTLTVSEINATTYKQAGVSGTILKTDAINNIYAGASAGGSLTTGGKNVLIGSNAGGSLTTGGINVLIGDNAGTNITTFPQNVAIGDGALLNSNAQGNTALGHNTLQNTTGSLNTAVGNNAMSGVTGTGTGTQNVAVGFRSLFRITNGNFNTCVGVGAGDALTTGSGNVLIGSNAEDNFTNPSNCVAVGSLTNVDGSNRIAIGYQATTTADNQVVLGNPAITENKFYGDITTNGDTYTDKVFTDQIEVSNITAPANPGSGKGIIYKKTGSNGLFYKPVASSSEQDLTNPGTMAEATNSVDCTSSSYVLMPNMTLTPGAGTYLVMFGGNFTEEAKGEAVTEYGIFNNGTLVASSRRRAWIEATNYYTPLSTQTIEVRWKETEGTPSVEERSLILVRVG